MEQNNVVRIQENYVNGHFLRVKQAKLINALVW